MFVIYFQRISNYIYFHKLPFHLPGSHKHQTVDDLMYLSLKKMFEEVKNNNNSHFESEKKIERTGFCQMDKSPFIALPGSQ